MTSTTAKSGVAGLKLAFGGVVVRRDGRVLLREPSSHYDGYVWTFPKGRPDRGESDEAAALREVLEETGVAAKIVARIEGDFAGGTTVNHYYLMEEADPGAAPGPHDRETSAVKWATFDEARAAISLTTNSKGRVRDLAVLGAAYAEWKARLRSE